MTTVAVPSAGIALSSVAHEVIENLYGNPGVASGTTEGFGFYGGNSGSSGAASVVDADWTQSGKAYRVTYSSSTGTINGHTDLRPVPYIEPGKRYTWVYKRRRSSAGDLPSPAHYPPQNATKIAGSGTVSVAADEVDIAWYTADMASSGIDPSWQVYFGCSNFGIGDYAEIGDVLMYEGDYDPTRTYFDGDTQDTPDFRYDWTGTPGASTSTRTNITPVPGDIYLIWEGKYSSPLALELKSTSPIIVIRDRIEPPTYTQDEYKAFFNSPLSVVTRRVEILEADGNTLWDDGFGNFNRLISGSISVDYTRDERRSADLELANFDNALIHQPEGFWYDKILRIFRGIKFWDVSGERYVEYQLAELMMDQVKEARFPNTVQITSRDYTKKCLLSKFARATAFDANYAIETVISSMASNAGITRQLIPATGKILGKDYFFEAGKSRWEAMKEIATAFGYELFFDAHGYLVMRPFIDPTAGGISHTLSTGPDGNLVTWEKSTDDSEIFNHITVTGSDTDSIPVWAEALNNEPTSPTRIAKLGDRTYPYQSAFVSTDAQAQDLASALLKIYALESYEINFTSLNAPWLEAGEVVRFIDPEASVYDPDRYLLTALNIPLTLDPMTGVGKRVTIVG